MSNVKPSYDVKILTDSVRVYLLNMVCNIKYEIIKNIPIILNWYKVSIYPVKEILRQYNDVIEWNV